MKTSFFHRVISCVAMLATFSLLPGCRQEVVERETGSSYAELVAIYSTEVADLERLEKKREELIKKHEEQLRPSAVDSLEALSAALNSARTSESVPDPDAAFDPNAMLDQAVADAQKFQDTTGKLLESLSSEREMDEEETKRLEKLGEEFQRELETLDKQIEQQKTRVDRARAARDAAEAKTPGP